MLNINPYIREACLQPHWHSSTCETCRHQREVDARSMDGRERMTRRQVEICMCVFREKIRWRCRRRRSEGSSAEDYQQKFKRACLLFGVWRLSVWSQSGNVDKCDVRKTEKLLLFFLWWSWVYWNWAEKDSYWFFIYYSENGRNLFFSFWSNCIICS